MTQQALFDLPAPVDDGYTTYEVTSVRADRDGWKVVLAVDEKGVVHTLVGVMPDVTAGVRIKARGDTVTHERFGEQVRVEAYVQVHPTSPEEIRRYLATGVITGIGEDLATRIVNLFGDTALDVMQNEPDRLLAVKGIGEKKLAKIVESWKQQTIIRDIALVAPGHITPNLAARIWKVLGDGAVAAIRTDPYRMVEVPGVGWASVDRTARDGMGVAEDAPVRIRAGIRHALSEAGKDGHCYLTQARLAADAVKVLRLPASVMRREFDGLVASGDLVVDEPDAPTAEQLVYTWWMWRVETETASHIQRIQGADVDTFTDALSLTDAEWDSMLADAGLSAEQEQAVRNALTHRVSIVTGGPGRGKSHTIAQIVAAARSQGAGVAMCAPTGRAAKRMEEMFPDLGVMEHKPETIHRLLGFRGHNNPDHDVDHPLSCDMLIVDEVSMVDVVLMWRLIQAVCDGAHVVLVGDRDQLPSIGPGNVLADLIDSGAVPVTRLTQVFRQGARSGIVAAADRINAGELPELAPQAYPDFMWVPREPDKVASTVEHLVAEQIPTWFGHRSGAIQVLAPMRRGDCGTNALNRLLQARLNPAGSGRGETVCGDTTFRVGDIVMQTQNNYDKDIFNGTTCRIERIGEDGELEVVTSDGDVVEYGRGDLSQLMLAYAITIHKSQGSEYPVTVIPVTMQSRIMLNRTLLYTAVTRAKQLVVLVGEQRALEYAVRTNRSEERWTKLASRLADTT